MSGALARITLLTDFGTADGYVAAMKGVIAAILPSVIIDDAAHDVPRGDVRAAAWALGAYWFRYPPGTVHVVVVDPGVGSERRAIALEADRRVIVAPDNGVVTAVLRVARVWRCVEIPVAADDAPTFHGRDVFAPAAARLAAGDTLDSLGSPVTDPIVLTLPRTRTADAASSVIIGTVVHVDHFGNLVTDISATEFTIDSRIEIAGRTDIRVVRTYADARSGELAGLIGSRGTLEVAVRDGSASEILGTGRGEPVHVTSPPAGR